MDRVSAIKIYYIIIDKQLNISGILPLLHLCLVTQIIQFTERSKQFSTNLPLFHAVAGVVICHPAISASSGW